MGGRCRVGTIHSPNLWIWKNINKPKKTVLQLTCLPKHQPWYLAGLPKEKQSILRRPAPSLFVAAWSPASTPSELIPRANLLQQCPLRLLTLQPLAGLTTSPSPFRPPTAPNHRTTLQGQERKILEVRSARLPSGNDPWAAPRARLKIISMNSNKCDREKSSPRSQQLLSYSIDSLSLENTSVHCYFYHCTTHTLSPNFFSPHI